VAISSDQRHGEKYRHRHQQLAASSYGVVAARSKQAVARNENKQHESGGGS